MATVILFTFYFAAKWHALFELFLLSCQSNPSIDFAVFTNLTALPGLQPYSTIDNVRLIHYKELKDVGIPLNITLFDSYKLHDLKPIYAKLFKDVVKDYTFWGFVDNDMVFGSNLKSPAFLSQQLLAQADIISATNSFCNGPFQLHRNKPLVNNLYERSPDLQLVLSSSNKSYGFDENHGTLKTPFPVVIWKQMKKGNLIRNTTAKHRVDDRFYFRSGAKKGFIWSPRTNPFLWNATSIYEIVDKSHPMFPGGGSSPSTPLSLVPIPLLHFISWKRLDTFISTPVPASVIDTIKSFSSLNQQQRRHLGVIISCRGFFSLDLEAVRYLETAAADDFSLDQLLDRAGYAETKPCAFDENNEFFYRRGRIPACRGIFKS